jgi:hypothetical protein
MVYADWLEGNGDLERAEFVRLQDVLVRVLDEDDQRYRAAFARACEIAERTDMAWRVLVARPRILNCFREDCPREWGALAPSERTDVRVCTRCVSRVPYCANTIETLEHNEHIEPYVIDVASRPLPIVSPIAESDGDEGDGTVFSDETPPWRA